MRGKENDLTGRGPNRQSTIFQFKTKDANCLVF